MTATSFRCKCGHDQEVEYETDGPEVLDVWSVDGELKCEVCEAELDRDAVYTAVSIDHASQDIEPADPHDAWSGGFAESH